MADAKKIRKMFSDLRKYIPFLKYAFELNPKENTKFKILIDWIKMKNQSNMIHDRWHAISGENTIRRTYEKLKNTTNFPIHIKEIFEGGTPIVISDNEDNSNLPSTSSVNKTEDNLTKDTAHKNKNPITKQQNSPTSRIKISQRLAGNKPQIDSQIENDGISTRGKKEQLLNTTRKTNSSSKFSSKSRRSSKHCKNSSKEKNDTTINKVDASVFDILSWKDLEKKDEKSPVPEYQSHKEPAYSLPSKNDINTESDKAKKTNYKHNPKNFDNNSTKIKHESCGSLIKHDYMEIKTSNNADNSNLKKPRLFELFQRRESTRSDRKTSSVEASIRDSVKSVLLKNPEIIAEVVKDGTGTKIVYDYTNVTKMTNSKTIPLMKTVAHQSESIIHELQSEGIDSKGNSIVTGNVNAIENITSKAPETNSNCSSGDAYRKAMKEQQIMLQYQESIQTFQQQKPQSSLLHPKNKMSNNSSVRNQSKQDILVRSSVRNKNSQQITDSTQPRSLNSESSSSTLGDHRRTSEPCKPNQLKSQSIGFDINTKNLNSSETREEQSNKRKTKQTKQTSSTATYENSSNFSKAKQKPKEDDEVVLMSFCGRSKSTHSIESDFSLEDYEPQKLNFPSRVNSSSVEKVNRNEFSLKIKGDATLKLSRKSKDYDSKSSKTKPISVCDAKKIDMPSQLNKDEQKIKYSKHTTKKTKHDSVTIKKLENADVSPHIDPEISRPKKDSDRDQIVDFQLKEQKCKSESNIFFGKTRKRKNSANQDPDCCLKQKLVNMDNVPENIGNEITNDCLQIDLGKSSEERDIKNKSISKKRIDKSIKVNDGSSKNQKDSKIEISKSENTKKTNLRSAKQTKIATPPDKDKKLILTSKKSKNSPVGDLKLKTHVNCLNIGKEEDSTQKIGNTKGSSKETTDIPTKLKHNSHTIVRDLKRKTSIESTEEIHSEPAKKSKISTQLKKDTTPKKHTNSQERRFNRELNNLSCTFRESLLPQTIRRRRCSSSWFNLSENASQKLESVNVDFTPAPILRRRKTCSAMANLKLTLQRSTDRSDEYHIKGIENNKSSDGTHENCERNKLMEGGVETDKDRNTCHKTLDSLNKEMPRLIPFDSKPMQNPIKSPGNNDSKMTFNSTRTCVLCNKNSNDLTNHYVLKHKTESYVSRLSSADIRGLEKEKNVTIPVSRNRHKINCVFCKQMLEDHFENLYAHFTYHTGEYNFQCEGCKIKKPYKEDIGSHQLRSRVCRNSKIIMIDHKELETTIIYLHICTICNFVNLNESNLEKHIPQQHGVMCNILKNSKKCILLVKDVHEIVPEVHSAGFDGNGCETYRPTAEEDPLCAEEHFKCELPMNIQNILMDEDNLANRQVPKEISYSIVPKIVNRQKCDITVLSGPDETIDSSLSPEELLELMHAPDNAESTTTTIVLGEKLAKDLQAEDSLKNSVSHNNKRRLDEFQVSETPSVNILTAAQNSKKGKFTTEILCESPKRSDTHESNNNMSIDLQTSEIPLDNIMTVVQSRSNAKFNVDLGEKRRSNSVSDSVEGNLDTIPASNRKTGQINENSFEDILDSESMSNMEACINSTNEVLCQNSDRCVQELHDPNNNMSIMNSSSANLCQRSETDIDKLYASGSSIEERSQHTEVLVGEPHVSEHLLIERPTQTQGTNKILHQSSAEPQIELSNPQQNNQSMIYRQYDKFDHNYLGLFKCLMDDCLYSTNSEEEFKMHWSNHNQNKILNCPYCFTKSSCLENFIHHILHEHSMSNYQCEKCAYRSMIPGNVIIHSKICHNDIKADTSIYKCGYLLKTSKESNYKTMPKKTRDNISSLKCPDCSDCYFSKDTIKTHIQNSHPLSFQRFGSLNLNELACIYCKNVSNCKEKMQIHLALQHPDEPDFVIERKLQPKGCEDTVEHLMVVDISIDVLKTDIRILEESLIIVDSGEDQEVLEIEPNRLEAVSNTQVSQIPALMLESSNKSCRSPGNCIIDHQAGQKPEANFNDTRTKSPFIEEKDSPMKKMDETTQTSEDCSAKHIESASVNCESHLNEQPQNLEEIQNLNVSAIIEELPDHLPIQSSNESYEPIQPVENKRLQVPFETTSNNFKEAVKKEGERIKGLLELLVENTGAHSSSLYRCPHCNSSFRHFELWLTHMKNKHKNIEDVHCPYCTKQLQLDSAESHFKTHLRHEFICYYCIASCCSKKKMQEHFASYHENCSIIECPITSFYLVIKQDAIISDYTALLEHFAEAIYLQVTKKIQRNTVNEWTEEWTDSCLDEMEIPQYKPGQPLFKCFLELCSFVAECENSFDDHLFQHKLPNNFICKHCMISIPNPTWDSIKCHIFQHQSPRLFVCGVCKFFHYKSEGIRKHIENLHNSRDVPVLNLLRGDLNYKISLSIFLPPDKIKLTTSKACFCCAEEIRNSNKYLYHLKKTHKLSLCPRCQLCDKIILTHLDGESHYKEYHQLESFKLKYEVLTTYLYKLVLRSRSPLTMEIRLNKKKSSDQQMESNCKESTSVAVKEEILVKSELEEDNQPQSITIKCLHTNQLLGNLSRNDGNTFQSNDVDVNSNKQLPSFFINHNVQNSVGGGLISENTSGCSEPQNLVPSTNNRVQVQASKTIQHSLPMMNNVRQYSSEEQAFVNEVPLLPQAAVPHSRPATDTRCFFPSPTHPDSLLPSQTQNAVITETEPLNFTLPNRLRDSLPSRETQHLIIQNIQLTTGKAILSIPLEVSTADQTRIGEQSQIIPVTTTSVAQPNIPQIAAPSPSIPFITNMLNYSGPLSNAIGQVSLIIRSNLNELSPICGNCNLECIDFVHLQSHYEATHVNEAFRFFIERKICCAYCYFQCTESSFAQHHALFHRGAKKLCRSVTDPSRCGICNNIFRNPPTTAANSYPFPYLCACPGQQRTIADCLNWPILKTLLGIGYQYYKYSCEVCKMIFQSAQEFVQHNVNIHNKHIDSELWRNKINYCCCMCSSVVSCNMLEVLSHMRSSHLVQMRLTFIEKFELYKRVKIIHSNGLIVYLSDLRNTGQFDEEKFKHVIYNFEVEQP